MRRALAILVLIAVACSKQPDAEKVSKTIDSWSADIGLVSHALQAHKVSKQYAKQVGEVAEEELSKQKVPPELAKKAHAVIEAAKKLQ
jgi:hypothetical protein